MVASYFLVPPPDRSDWAHLACLIGGVVHRLAPLGFAFGQPTAVSDDYVAGLLPARATRARLYRARVRPAGVVARLPDVWLPPHLVVRALVLHGPYLYVGGSLERPHRAARGCGATAGRLDLRDAQPRWEPLRLPGPAVPGKAVDDVLADDRALVVVDNAVFPKYLFVYPWSAADALPSAPHVVELPFSRVYEYVVKGQLSPGYLALRSTSAGMDGVGTYVSVLRRSDWAPVVVFAYEQSREELWAEVRLLFPGDPPARSACPFDLAMQEHTLVLACPGALLHIDLRAFPIPTRPPNHARWDEAAPELAYPIVDLRDDAPVHGVRWEMLAPYERPDGIRFVAPGQLLLTSTGNSEPNAEQAWMRNALI